jgi:hypothetical protein
MRAPTAATLPSQDQAVPHRRSANVLNLIGDSMRGTTVTFSSNKKNKVTFPLSSRVLAPTFRSAGLRYADK